MWGCGGGEDFFLLACGGFGYAAAYLLTRAQACSAGCAIRVAGIDDDGAHATAGSAQMVHPNPSTEAPSSQVIWPHQGRRVVAGPVARSIGHRCPTADVREGGDAGAAIIWIQLRLLLSLCAKLLA